MQDWDLYGVDLHFGVFGGKLKVSLDVAMQFGKTDGGVIDCGIGIVWKTATRHNGDMDCYNNGIDLPINNVDQ